jgi:hypothetical protein
MNLHTILNILAVLVLLVALRQVIGYFRWQHFDCHHCEMKLRFRGISRTEEDRLAKQWLAHIASHAVKPEEER